MPARKIADDDAFDERGLLRDGARYRVPMAMRDSGTVQAAIAAARQVPVTDASGDSGLGLHKPGNRRLSDASSYDAAEQAYDAMCRASSEAWKAGPNPQLDASPPAGAYPYEAHKEGTSCTVNGAPGTLQREGNYLICKPDAQRRDSMSVGDAEAIKTQAYEQRVKDGEAAWKTLGQ